jgi:Ca2+-binding RTX toxin-like protein
VRPPGHMKKSILIVLTLFAALLAPPVHAEPGPLTLLLSGNRADNVFRIGLSPDGREYLISSEAMLEAGGDICWHPEERMNELACEAPAIAGFEVNVAGGNDLVVIGSDIPIPATLRGGSGRDRLTGGGVADKIVGGPDADILTGRRGDDLLLGGPGADRLVGGQGNDHLRGGPDTDLLVGGPGHNSLLP